MSAAQVSSTIYKEYPYLISITPVPNSILLVLAPIAGKKEKVMPADVQNDAPENKHHPNQFLLQRQPTQWTGQVYHSLYELDKKDDRPNVQMIKSYFFIDSTLIIYILKYTHHYRVPIQSLKESVSHFLNSSPQPAS